MKSLSLSFVALLAITGCSASQAHDEDTSSSRDELRRIDTPHVECVVPQIACGTDAHAVTHRGLFGCFSYCVTCPEIDAIVCNPEDTFVSGKDADGCEFAYCKPPAEPPHP